jgi:glycosyltransferase involved in cell wall biosynthesis
MSESYPLVTIGIPTYNRYEQLQNCLEKALEQDYPNYEVLVSDNSQDEEIPLWLVDLIETEDKLTYVKQSKNIGAIKNHQFLLENARGKYFMWMHDDDIFPTNYILLMVDQLEKNKHAMLAGPSCDRYLEGEYWLTYENWDNRGKSTYTRLKELIPDAFVYHWRFEQYMYGVFKRNFSKYKISPDFKSQFHFFFSISEKGEILHIPDLKIQKNTTKEELKKYSKGEVYRKYKILRFFSFWGVQSLQQCIPITIQMLFIISTSKNLSNFEKIKLTSYIISNFFKHSIIHEVRSKKGALKNKADRLNVLLQKSLSSKGKHSL